MTLTEVKGFGRQKGHTEVFRGKGYSVDYLPKIKLQVLLTDEMADQVAQRISDAARTSKIGDGKIFIISTDEVIRIRTGEKGPNAI